jgi:pimeloyl-ACP methyl ester carboxylesterase
MRELLEKYTNRFSRFLVIDGMQIHYRDEGEGEPILLLHGAFSSLHTFNDWTVVLKKNGFRVVRLDAPGFGLTGPHPDHIYTIPNHLRILGIFLDMLGIPKCHIAGSSMGGWLAWEFALKYPERTNKIILLDAAGFLDPKSIPLPFRMAQTPFLNRVIKYAINRPMLETFVRQVYFDQSKVNDLLLDRYYDLVTRPGNPEAFLLLVNGKFKDNTPHLRQIKAPTLIMWGNDDKWLPVENAYRFHKGIPNSQLIIYKNVGHIPMEEIPDISIKDALHFLLQAPHNEPTTLHEANKGKNK